MLILKALNIALFYLFVVWAWGLFLIKESPYPGLYYAIFFLLVVYWFLTNTITFVICYFRKTRYDLINLLSIAGLFIAIIVAIIIL